MSASSALMGWKEAATASPSLTFRRSETSVGGGREDGGNEDPHLPVSSPGV